MELSTKRQLGRDAVELIELGQVDTFHFVYYRS